MREKLNRGEYSRMIDFKVFNDTKINEALKKSQFRLILT